MTRPPVDSDRSRRPASMVPRTIPLGLDEKDSPMCRPRREFRAECFVLEGRSLLAVLPHVHSHPVVGFEGTMKLGTKELSQLVTQQDGEATVSLSGYIDPGAGTLQVVVATDPSSPVVGVNVGAVDQTVTFTNGVSEATVKVPILADAPNPG